MPIRCSWTTSFALVSALALSPSLGAQVLGRRPSAPTTRIWLGGAAGATGGSSGAVLQWEGAIAYGLFAAGYQDSRSDDFAGGSRHEQVVYGGVQVPWRRLSVLVAAGAGNAMKCTSGGEQSGTCTRSHDFHVPVLKLSADILLLPFAGIYFSALQPIRRDIAFPAYVIGLEIGKLR